MARRPFFGQGGAIPIAKMNMQAATAPGRAYAQMGKDFGEKIGNAIKQYGLNKVKRAKLTGEIEAYYEQNPNAISEIGMSGDEAQDKKDFSEREKFMKGNMSMAQLEGYAGKLARGDVLKTKAAEAESRRIANEMGGLNLSIANELKDTQINIGRDKEVVSRLGVELAQETNPQKKKLIQAQFTDAIANLGLGGKRRELEGKLLKSKLSLVDPQTNAARSALTASQIKTDTDVADVLNRGGPGGVANERQKDRELSREDIKSQIESRQITSAAQLYKSMNIGTNAPQDLEKRFDDIALQISKVDDSQIKVRNKDGDEVMVSLKDYQSNPDNFAPLVSDRLKALQSKKEALIEEQTSAALSAKIPYIDPETGETKYTTVADKLAYDQARAKKTQDERQAQIEENKAKLPNAFYGIPSSPVIGY